MRTGGPRLWIFRNYIYGNRRGLWGNVSTSCLVIALSLTCFCIFDVRKVVSVTPDLATTTDPLVFGAGTTNDSYLGSNRGWRTEALMGGVVMVRTDTHRHVDSDGIEMTCKSFYTYELS